MSQMGTNKQISIHTARSIVLYPHSQNGGAARDCHGQLSTVTSNYWPT